MQAGVPHTHRLHLLRPDWGKGWVRVLGIDRIEEGMKVGGDDLEGDRKWVGLDLSANKGEKWKRGCL